MSTTITLPAEAAPLSRLEQRRREVEQKRLANTARAEALAEERELALLDDEEAYEEARAKAYDDPAIGPDRCVGGLLRGAGAAGHVLFKWPGSVDWTHFQNRGILKKDGLTTELADQLTCKCLLYPSLEAWGEIRRRNPSASMQSAVQITEAMSPAEQDAGKGLRSSRAQR